MFISVCNRHIIDVFDDNDDDDDDDADDDDRSALSRSINIVKVKVKVALWWKAYTTKLTNVYTQIQYDYNMQHM